MITAAEALEITAGTLTEESKSKMLAEVERRIRVVAAEGLSSLRIEHETDAINSFLRAELTQAGFSLSDIGLTVYW